jgi:hypothetical protein
MATTAASSEKTFIQSSIKSISSSIYGSSNITFLNDIKAYETVDIV